MFKISKSASTAFRQKSTAAVAPAQHDLGTDSRSRNKTKKPKAANNGDYVSESYELPTSLGPGSNLSSNAVTIDMEPLLTGLTPQVEAAFYRLYRDIYYFDSVAGSAVDLISQVTFSSEFSLGGISNPKISAVYEESLDRLNTRSLLPEMSTDHLVLGVHCSSLLYNKQKRVFTDLMCHPVETLTVTDLPFYSQDPLINVKFTTAAIAAVSSSSHATAH